MFLFAGQRFSLQKKIFNFLVGSLTSRNGNSSKLYAASSLHHESKLPVPKTRRSKSTAFVIEDKEWANKIYKAIDFQSDVPANDVLLVLTCPGNGPLTEHLLKKTDHRILVYEAQKEYKEYLMNMAAESNGKLFCEFSHSAFWSGTNVPFEFGGNMVKFVGGVPDIKTLVTSLMSQFLQKSGFWGCGEVECYLIIPELEFKNISNARKLWAEKRYLFGGLCHLFFDVKQLLQIPMLVASKESVKRYSKGIDVENSNLVLVRLTISEKTKSMAREGRLHRATTKLIGLVNHSRNVRVIPWMELHCPDFGYWLVEAGVGMMDRNKDVPLDMWLEIYEALISSPNYMDSTMRKILEGSLKTGIDIDTSTKSIEDQSSTMEASLSLDSGRNLDQTVAQKDASS